MHEVEEPGNSGGPTLYDLLECSYRTYADRIAVDDGCLSLTYGELRDSALRIATWLTDHGVARGDRVVLVTNNRVEYSQVEHAVVLGGFIRVALAPRLHPVEVAGIIADCTPSCVVIEASWLAQEGAEFLADFEGHVVVIGSTDPGAQVELPNAVPLEAVLEDVPDAKSFPAPAPDDKVWFIYTSGSTGLPKGVIHTHASVTAMITGIRWAMTSVDETDTAIHTAPLAHVSGAVGWALTSAGGRNRMLAKFSPEGVFDVAEEIGATVLPVVPTQLNMLTDYLKSVPRNIDNIRLVPYAGSAIAPDRLSTAKEFFGNALVQLFGASEAPMPLTALFPADHIPVTNSVGLPRFASAGRAAPGVEIEIRDSQNRRVGVGEPGEITVKTPTACQGYWNNPEATAELFDDQGFVRTGDVGLLDEDDFLFIVDRKKDMIVSGGFNVYPREVETAISTVPGVREVAVVGAPDEKWGEQIVAVLSLEEGVSYTLEQIRDHCRSTLAGYKLPRRVEVVGDLPKGPTGKILKKTIRAEFWTDSIRRVGG
ncbi:class I adenylate-forming enzyme family protein [Rhodococcus aetherivorans]|uniref:class I adenylate-forming enzyme family protein n=1 Tax=Rhodococcus aetherivorans TaxID=191292 RepID=UPI00163A399B|nr:AMP-binding protein [Rhodococcus aetherivorans]MBC2589254.1 AMP-binding protein [Rhodococcus aetherivorans]